MVIQEITDIKRVESDIFYIRRYSAFLVYSLPQQDHIVSEIRFSIEYDAIGNASVVVNFLKPIDYPLIPARKKVTAIIKEYDQKGLLK